jgi:DNA repair ATPase RecN
VIRLNKAKDSNKINPYIYDSIPSIFTTLGILGTFVGIYFGLQKFDVNNITESIPSLLEGLKTAFSTSIVGIVLSVIFGKVTQIVLRKIEINETPPPTNELGELRNISKLITNSNAELTSHLKAINKSLTDDKGNTTLLEIKSLNNNLEKSHTTNFKEINELKTIALSLSENQKKIIAQIGTDEKQTVAHLISSNSSEQIKFSELFKAQVGLIVENLHSSNAIISKKFDEFSRLLEESNTKALVEVMKSATEQFNSQMKELIDKLVKENFKELNNSVLKMNEWQQQNKEMIEKLTAQFHKVSKDFESSSSSIKTITENTQKLTDENSHLSSLIVELQKVMIEDTKYQEIITKLNSTIETLSLTTDEFEDATTKLQKWIQEEKKFKDSVDILITRLKEIEKIKDINGEFWTNTKKQFEEGVGIISKASSKLETDIKSINQLFYKELNDTLNSLDSLIQQFFQNRK